jgi:Glycosyltransferase
MNQKKLKISLAMPSFNGGGAQRVMINVAKGLRDRGYEVEFVVLNASGPMRGDVPPEVAVVSLEKAHARGALMAARRYLREKNPDLMITNLPHISALMRAAATVANYRKPIVPVLHNTFSIQFNRAKGLRRWVVKKSACYVLKRAPLVVAVSQGVKDDAVEHAGLAPERCEVIYNPVINADVLEMGRQPFDHPWLGQEGEAPVLCAVGRLTHQKDYPTLLKAFRSVKQARQAKLLILGEGELRGSLGELVDRLGLGDAVDLLGFLGNPHACVTKCRGLVLSSRWEGLGNVLIEALAVGTPVASTDCPSGPKEILENGKWGYLAKPGDENDLAAAMMQLIDDPKPVPGPEVLKKYTIDHAVSRYVEVVESLI